MEKERNKRFKEQMKKRQNELPEVLRLLEGQQELLNLLVKMDYTALQKMPLHDIVQNLTIKATEITSKELISPCYDWNCYAINQNKGVSWFKFLFCKQLRAKKRILKKQDKRLKQLLEADGEDVIHSFTEIVDNLQRIVPEKTAEMVVELKRINEQAIKQTKQAIKNYARLTLD